MKTQVNQLKLSNEDRQIIEKLSISCTRLYNVGLYSIKTHYENTSEYLNYAKNYHECKTNEHYKLLLTDIGQQILRIVDRNYKSFFALLKLKNKGSYSEKVNNPKFKNTNEYSCITVQGRSAQIRNGYVNLGLTKTFRTKYNIIKSKLQFKLPKHLKIEKLQELRIVPKYHGKIWEIHFIYLDDAQLQATGDGCLGIDLGIDNFATCFDSQTGYSFILDGKYIKSQNQLFNKAKTKLKTNSNKYVRISNKRNNRINERFRHYVNYIIKYCRNNEINQIIIGELNKSRVNIGEVNNQKFCYIPHGKFIQQLKNKCQVNGIEVHLQDESYSSKCSFFDKEEVTKHDNYVGKRVKRGLFQTSEGLLVNADVNGAANILIKSKRRVSDRAFSGFVNNPVRIFLSSYVL